MLKGDITIGYRAYEEVLRLFPMMKDAAISLGCKDNNIYKWREGVSPSAKFLARLLVLGADIPYILTGRRPGNEKCSDKHTA